MCLYIILGGAVESKYFSAPNRKWKQNQAQSEWLLVFDLQKNCDEKVFWVQD